MMLLRLLKLTPLSVRLSRRPLCLTTGVRTLLWPGGNNANAVGCIIVE